MKHFLDTRCASGLQSNYVIPCVCSFCTLQGGGGGSFPFGGGGGGGGSFPFGGGGGGGFPMGGGGFGDGGFFGRRKRNLKADVDAGAVVEKVETDNFDRQ